MGGLAPRSTGSNLASLFGWLRGAGFSEFLRKAVRWLRGHPVGLRRRGRPGNLRSRISFRAMWVRAHPAGVRPTSFRSTRHVHAKRVRSFPRASSNCFPSRAQRKRFFTSTTLQIGRAKSRRRVVSRAVGLHESTRTRRQFHGLRREWCPAKLRASRHGTGALQEVARNSRQHNVSLRTETTTLTGIPRRIAIPRPCGQAARARLISDPSIHRGPGH